MNSSDASTGISSTEIPATGWSLLLSTLLWSLSCGAITGGAWACGFVLASTLLAPPFSRPVRSELLDEAIVWGVVGGCCGLVVGSIIGSIRGNGDRTGRIVALALCAGLTGAIGGGLAPLLVVETEGVLSPFASSTLALAIAGSLSGGIALGVSRLTRERHDLDEDEDATQRQEQSSTWLPRRPLPRMLHKPGLIYSPIFTTSIFALVAAAAIAPSLAALVLLTNGLLGLAIAFALLFQERRIRELERHLGRR